FGSREPTACGTRYGGLPQFSGRQATAVAAILCRELEGRERRGAVRRRELRVVAVTYSCFQRSAVFVHFASVCAGRYFRQFGHPEISDRAANGEWRHLGLGRLLSRCRLLPRFLHTCLELRAGFSQSLPATGAYVARTGAGPLDGRERPCHVPLGTARRPGQT